MKCEICKKEIKENKVIDIEFGNEKYKLEVMPIEQKGIAFNKLVIPKGFRLSNQIEAFRIYDEKLEDFDSGNNDFWVEQPSKRLKKLGKVARLNACSVRAILYCYWDPSDLSDRLGAIFVRRLK